MKPQTRYFTAAALLAIGSIAAAALFPRANRALCGQGGGIWHNTQDYCIRPDCRQQHNCGEHAFVPREQCQTIRAGDTLDKAWFILGEPAQSHGNHWVWEAKGGGKTAEIRADGERVGTVRCGGE